MLPVLSTSHMRTIDERAIAGNTAVGYSYMVKAGIGLLNAVRELVPDCRAGDIAVVCGKGNNGGDGYVVARLLLEAGYNVMCLGLCAPESLQSEAKIAYDEYSAHQGSFLFVQDSGDLPALPGYALIIDAILGTGINGAPRGLIALAIDAINKAGVPVLSVDTPSGLDCDSGMPYEPCIKATMTVTMGFAKIGFYFYPGRTQVGRLIVCDLGYPDDIVQQEMPDIFLPTAKRLAAMVPPRKPQGSKFDHGVALMLAGSRGMTGSAILAARACMRSGCGMVQLAAVASIIPIVTAHAIEVVCNAIDETFVGSAAYSSITQCRQLMQNKQTICIGPGLSHHTDTMRLVQELVQSSTVPIVLDADGINAFKDAIHLLKERSAPCLITPHAGEWNRLFGTPGATPLQLIATLRQKSAEFGITVLYKGSPTLVADPHGAVYVLPYGNSGMATAGSGDVLSGIITGLVAQGCSLTNAAVLGAYLHGEAGNAAAEVFGEHSMIAGDMVELIGRGFKSLTE